jgi:hypothetical protein
MALVTNFLNRVATAHTPATAPIAKTPRQVRTSQPAFHTLLANSSAANTPAVNSLPTPAAAQVTPSAAPTAESVFGANPWVPNPVGFNPNGSQFSYNPVYFATSSTAQQVAKMLGGTVVASNALAPNAQQQPNLMVQMPDGRMINAGLVASFYTHGYPQSYIDGLIDSEINGSAT